MLLSSETKPYMRKVANEISGIFILILFSTPRITMMFDRGHTNIFHNFLMIKRIYVPITLNNHALR